MPLFVIIVLSVWTLLHVYVAVRLVSPLPLRRSFRIALGLMFLPSYALLPLSFLVKDALVWPYDIILVWLAFVDAGAFSILFALIGARDVGAWLLELADRFRRARRGHKALLPRTPERRRFLLNLSGAAAVTASGVLTYKGVR